MFKVMDKEKLFIPVKSGFPTDAIKLLDWLEETGRNYPIRIHSMNPVGVANMRAIIEKNGWKEIK